MFDQPVVNYKDINYDNIIYDKIKNKLLYKYNSNTPNEIIDDFIIIFDYDNIYLSVCEKYICVYYFNDFFDKLNEKLDIDTTNKNINNNNHEYYTYMSYLARTNKNSIITLHPSRKSGQEKIVYDNISQSNINIIESNLEKYFMYIFNKNNKIIAGRLLMKPEISLFKFYEYDENNNKIPDELNPNKLNRNIKFYIINLDIKYNLSYAKDEVNKNIYYKENKIDELTI